MAENTAQCTVMSSRNFFSYVQ